jgi:redox-sensing transcriptional repressor
MMNQPLPPKTVERLSRYRRCLEFLTEEGRENIFSHELAAMLHLTPVQVRRDIMLIGHEGSLRQGYIVKDLLEMIVEIIDFRDSINIAIVGYGDLGRAIMHYIQTSNPSVNIAAAFDVNPSKIGKYHDGILCFHVADIVETMKEYDIRVAVLTTPPEVAQQVANDLVASGIRGILNYTTRKIKLPEHIFLEEYDMIMSLEKVSYFVSMDEDHNT